MVQICFSGSVIFWRVEVQMGGKSRCLVAPLVNMQSVMRPTSTPAIPKTTKDVWTTPTLIEPSLPGNHDGGSPWFQTFCWFPCFPRLPHWHYRSYCFHVFIIPSLHNPEPESQAHEQVNFVRWFWLHLLLGNQILHAPQIRLNELIVRSIDY